MFQQPVTLCMFYSHLMCGFRPLIVGRILPFFLCVESTPKLCVNFTASWKGGIHQHFERFSHKMLVKTTQKLGVKSTLKNGWFRRFLGWNPLKIEGRNLPILRENRKTRNVGRFHPQREQISLKMWVFSRFCFAVYYMYILASSNLIASLRFRVNINNNFPSTSLLTTTYV